MQVWRARGIFNDKRTEKMIHIAQGDSKEDNSSSDLDQKRQNTWTVFSASPLQDWQCGLCEA